MALAVVCKPMMFLGEQVVAGSVVDTTGLDVSALVSTGYLGVLPEDPDMLEQLAQSIRDRQDEKIKKEQEAVKRIYEYERQQLLKKAEVMELSVQSGWKNSTILKKINILEPEWKVEAMSDTPDTPVDEESQSPVVPDEVPPPSDGGDDQGGGSEGDTDDSTDG